MTIEVSNLTFDAYANVGFTTIPELFLGQGDGQINLSQLNSQVSVNFLKNPENNLPLLVLHNYTFDINESNVKAHFKGNNDVFTLLDMAGNTTIPLIVKLLGKNATAEDRLMIQEVVNGILGSIPSVLQIPSTDVAFNFGLADSPSIHDGYAQFAIDGTSTCVNESACKHYPGPQPVRPPYIKPFSGSGAMQVMIADYLINSLLYAAYEDSLLNFEVTSEMVNRSTNGSFELNTDSFALFIPQIKEHYGAGRPINLGLSLTSPPSLSIAPTGMTRKQF